MDRQEFESAYIRTLAFLMLARVDGKSPVEYLVGDAEKQQLVRELSFALISRQTERFDEAFDIIQKGIGR